MADIKPVPAPPINPESKAFWEAATEQTLLVRKCRACGKFHHYPRAICPHCFSTEVEWITASGYGSIYAFSVMWKAKDPYVLAYVTLEEGVSMLTNIVDCDFNAVRIGQQVRVKFVPSTAATLVPMFTPV